MSMLSEAQSKVVWNSWLSAEIRAQYFAVLSARYQRMQRNLLVAGLILSSGAALSFLLSIIPPSYAWSRPVLTLLAAVVNALSLAMKNERNAIDCGDLHFRWNNLARGYEDLWLNTAADDAQERFDQLRRTEAEISKSGTSMPEIGRLLDQAQDNVVMHHQQETLAQ